VAAGTTAAAARAPGAAMQTAAPGPMHQVFDSLRETVAPGVARVSLSVMLAPGSTREIQRATMQAVLEAERKADAGLGAVRVLGFLPPPAGHAAHPEGLRMIPFAIVTWAPPGGWDSVTAANAKGPHTTRDLFVTDLPGHQPVPGAGGSRGP
jgi:hypothetical protein